MKDLQHLTQKEIAGVTGLTRAQVCHALTRARHNPSKLITYHDKLEYTAEDVTNLIDKMKAMQDALMKVSTKQVKASLTLPDTKPIGLAYWGDWHVGGLGTDYTTFEQDHRKIRDTEGLYFIGSGDYKDNYLTGGHPGAQYEQILQPGMQDLAVTKYMAEVGEKALALIRGCHDHWDKKQADQDFIAHLAHITNSINLWHGGELNINLGDQVYHWRCRHKFKYQSSLNVENAMRRIMEIQGPCDVAAEAHWHNPYIHMRHLMGQYRVLLRSGSYKVWDEHGQQIAGYKGKVGVPVVILYPDRHAMTPELFLDDAIPILNSLRR